MSAQEIVLFESSDGAITLPVEVDSKTVWLNAEQMSSLFDGEISVIRRHVRNVFNEKKLVEGDNVHFLHVAGSLKPVALYCLGVIISVGYRAKSQRGAEFRRWATDMLRRYITQGYAANNRRLRELGRRLIQRRRRRPRTSSIVVKDHSFLDGNKRIAAALFLYFLDRNRLLYDKTGNKRLGLPTTSIPCKFAWHPLSHKHTHDTDNLVNREEPIQMSLNSTPSANRLHIGFFGCRNAGKSSIVNAVTGQDLAVVSNVAGTTTDPVQKTMELLPLGPVVIIDTPGFDDEGMLGQKRVLRTKQTLNRTDIAVLVVDATTGMRDVDEQLVELFEEKLIPYVVVYNKCDLLGEADRAASAETTNEHALFASALTGAGIYELKERLGSLAPKPDPNHRLLGDLIEAGDLVVLVCPIDESAPKGRMILPQQMAIRDVLDSGATAAVCRETELASTLAALGRKPALVVTDSQAFRVVDEVTPNDIPLTSFSILMARYKGFLQTAAAGVAAIDQLQDGDVVLMAEGCTHHRQCNDIGTVKIPRWLSAHTGKDLKIETCSGRGFPQDLSPYALVIHCGGCMITEREVQYRMRCAEDQGVPFTNYGMVIARITGALERSVRLFPQVHKLFEQHFE